MLCSLPAGRAAPSHVTDMARWRAADPFLLGRASTMQFAQGGNERALVLFREEKRMELLSRPASFFAGRQWPADKPLPRKEVRSKHLPLLGGGAVRFDPGIHHTIIGDLVIMQHVLEEFRLLFQHLLRRPAA